MVVVVEVVVVMVVEVIIIIIIIVVVIIGGGGSSNSSGASSSSSGSSNNNSSSNSSSGGGSNSHGYEMQLTEVFFSTVGDEAPLRDRFFLLILLLSFAVLITLLVLLNPLLYIPRPVISIVRWYGNSTLSGTVHSSSLDANNVPEKNYESIIN